MPSGALIPIIALKLYFCEGLIKENLDFEFGAETQIYYSCIVTLFGEFYVLGGSSQNGRQVNPLLTAKTIL